ncbi:ABC transporter permease [Streptomyces sp. NPDC015232]|uniref:ABC transporter permease n=1 Tax=unclassified Streptomyces TaxID=2593676 RepID=UPI003701AE8B
MNRPTAPAAPAVPAPAPSPSPWSAVARAVLLLTALVAVLLTAFAWPAVRSDLHDVPLAVAGPAPAVAEVTTALERQRPGAFEVTGVADTAAAERLIRERKVYGAIDLGSGTPQVLIASAASAPVAQALQGLGAALGASRTPVAAAGAQAGAGAGAQAGAGADAGARPAVPVRDLVALPAEDPRGAGLSAGALPLVMGGLLAALVLGRLVRGAGRRVVGALAFAVTGGLAVVTVLQCWLGSLGGSYLANAGAVALAVAATSLAVIGLEALLGTAGFGLGAVVMMLVGNPLSGTATAPEMLPVPFGALGQLLPPGAGGRLLRSTAFFDGHGAAQPVLVLLAWLALGALLASTAALRAGRTARTAARTAVPAADRAG